MPIWLAVAVDPAFIGCFSAIGLVGNSPQQKKPAVKEVRKRKRRSPRRKAKVVKFPVISGRRVASPVAANEPDRT